MMENSSPNFEYVSCLCGSESFGLILKGKDQIYNLPGEFSVVECKRCGLLFTNPRPAPEVMHRYYPEDYGPYLDTMAADVNEISGQKERNKTDTSEYRLSIIKRVLRYCYDRALLFKKKCRNKLYELVEGIVHTDATALPAFDRTGTVLEIGCASGSFLKSLQDRRWDAYGLEYSRKAANYAKNRFKLKVEQGTVESMDYPKNYFDLVVGWMVLEHLHDPLKGLKNIYSVLKPDGHFAFSVPNAASFEFKLFKHNWYALQLPNHLYHFTTHTITRLLSEAGFSVERIIYQRNPKDLVASVCYWLQEKWGDTFLTEMLFKLNKNESIWFFLAMNPITRVLSFLKLTSRMTIWARNR